MSCAEINREALREIYPAISLGCFIKKPVSIDYLVYRIMSELDLERDVSRSTCIDQITISRLTAIIFTSHFKK
jgi:hypothetical protein